MALLLRSSTIFCTDKPSTAVRGVSHVGRTGLRSISLHRAHQTRLRALGEYNTVNDAMTSGRIIACSGEDSIETALEMLVEYRITGLPVIDANGHVVGVVSDYDLLALDALGRTTDEELFPTADQTWQAFKEVKTLLAKAAGKRVKDVMTSSPITVTPSTNINEAARILLSKKIRRLPVVDDDGKLVGVLSRGNLVKAALFQRKSQKPAT